jgi:hypothetical protein
VIIGNSRLQIEHLVPIYSTILEKLLKRGFIADLKSPIVGTLWADPNLVSARVPFG